ncbi:hypothetical protein BRADI_2g27750v3 [Brachypodium distachyon]|uniref:Uncharacterized protein n=1 Tax=Brachypodium distachyon TaxID=15368 RepID=A0A2K2DB05_BRADI|nr:hypothetical protein BRADI_2g27750v3 [Brachypodium distachyon]
MELVIAAIIGEVANRSISFLFDKYSSPMAPAKEEEKLQILQRLLLRVRVIVEEAERRHIGNRAMVHQLGILRKEMYRGYYILDTFRSQGNGEDGGVSHSFALSKFNPAKRLFLCIGDTSCEKELQQVLNNLNDIIVDVSDFVVFLKNYPPLYRQPYSMHLLLDRCMFGRQMELEMIMDFLRQTKSPGTETSIDVLPIVGPVHVGKSTLVSHVCNDERVRDLFSQIVLVGEDDLRHRSLNFKDLGHTMNQRNGSLTEKEAMLIIIELPEDIDEATWRNLYSAYDGHTARGTRKIIITSRSSKIVDFGTVQPLVLSFLPREAYWYFFKVLAFGSADPDDQPKLSSIAMEFIMGMNQSFVAANMFASLLRSNLNPQFWRRTIKFGRQFVQGNISEFGEHPCALVRKNRPACLERMANRDSYVIRKHYQTSFKDQELPRITFMDLLFRNLECGGRIEVLAWRSRLPPYRNHLCSCEIQKPQRMVEEATAFML